MKYKVKPVVPNLTLWAVLYHRENKSLEALPVLWFESQLLPPVHMSISYDAFQPVALSNEGELLTEISKTDNYLGLSFSPRPSKITFEKAIKAYEENEGKRMLKMAESLMSKN